MYQVIMHEITLLVPRQMGFVGIAALLELGSRKSQTHLPEALIRLSVQG